MTEQRPLLGVLGGLGPMSTFYFCELLTAHTKAASDADHMDMIISSRASTPDRTAFILGKSGLDPLPVMTEEAHRLVEAGADLIVIPCNTAHYFYEGLQKECRVPILNIIKETVNHLKKSGVRKFGLLATEGTVKSGSYQRLCAGTGLECVVPDEDAQAIVTSLIYRDIKQNKEPDMDAFYAVAESLRRRGCEKLVLGCTELSLIKKKIPDDSFFVDSLEALAHATILSVGKTPVGFPADYGDAPEVKE